MFGIVLNTGIIFIEFADILVRRRTEQLGGDSDTVVDLSRMEFRQCLIDAGKQRMLPIFLTTATTVGGLLPLSLFGGALFSPMMNGMIFGLIVSTGLTLFVIPVVYTMFDKLTPAGRRESPA